MKSFRLQDREIGAHFCGLERDLIFDETRTHEGWVHYVTENSFRLVKSRFTDIDKSILYSIPVDIKPPDEGDFVRVEPGREKKIVRSANKSAGRTDNRFRSFRLIEVDDIGPGRLRIPPPLLPRDEFLGRVTDGWANAQEDMLDVVMALLLVSAPPSVYGRGGVGSEGLEGFRMEERGSPRDVARTIMDQIPVEFRIPGRSPYRYMSLGSVRDIRTYRKDNASESNFTIVKPHRVTDSWTMQELPIQLPFVLKDSMYRRRSKEFDLDIMDYQLSALYLPPPPSKDLEKMAEKAVRSVYRYEFFDKLGFGEPDPMGSVRLALAMGRLNVGKEWTGRKYIRKSFAGMKEGEEIFSRLMKRGYEEVGNRAREESAYDMHRTLPGREKLKERDRRIYYMLRSRAEETGLEETPRIEILPDENPALVDESLERLNRYGYILFLQGGTVIRVVRSYQPEDRDG